MENQRRSRNGVSPMARRLRFEPLESRLPFAVEAIPLDLDLSFMPVADGYVIFEESSTGSLDSIGYDFGASIASEISAVEVVFAAPTSELVPTASGSIPIEFIHPLLDDPVFSIDGWLLASTPLSVPLPLDGIVIEELVMPVGEFDHWIFDEGLVHVGVTSTGEAGIWEREVFSVHSSLAYLALVAYYDSSMPSEQFVLVGGAREDTSAEVEEISTSPRSNREPIWTFDTHPGSFQADRLISTNHAGQVRQHYQTLDEIVHANGIESKTDAQLFIGDEHATTARRSRRQSVDVGSSLDSLQTTAQMSGYALPEGMLAIGNEAGGKNYRRVRALRLDEDFVAQTMFICDDLKPTAIPIGEPTEYPTEDSPSLNMPARFHWVAIGSTILVTHATLLARHARYASAIEWFETKLRKFTKHDLV